MVEVKQNPQSKLKIDFDRGVIFSQHPSMAVWVYMYVDSPGHYLNAFGNPVPEQLAKEAGFDVEKHAKERKRRERMQEAKDAIDAELAEINEENAVVVKEKGGFKVVDIGLGRHNVLDPDGNRLNPVPLSLDLAEKLVDRLVPDVA